MADTGSHDRYLERIDEKLIQVIFLLEMILEVLKENPEPLFYQRSVAVTVK